MPYITGSTTSGDFPIVGPAHQERLSYHPADNPRGARQNAFLAKLDPEGGLLYSTYIGRSNFGWGRVSYRGRTYTAGGASDELYQSGRALAVDAYTVVYVVGNTAGIQAIDVPFGGPAPPGDPFHINDAFLHRVNLNPAGSSYGRVVSRWNLFANYHLGRSGNDYAAGGADVATGVALSRARDVFVTGYSGSDDLYTSPGARQRYATPGMGTSPNDNDSFVVQFDGPDDDAADDVQIIGGFEYATYLGGAGDDRAQGIAVDAAERAYIGGGTTHDSFPTTANAYQRRSTSQPTLAGAGFVSILLESGSALASSTLLGGHTTSIQDIAIDDANRPFVTGQTRNPADGDAGGGVPGGGPMLGGGGNPSPDESEDAHGTFPLTPDATDREQGAGPRAFLSWLAADGIGPALLDVPRIAIVRPRRRRARDEGRRHGDRPRGRCRRSGRPGGNPAYPERGAA